MWYRKKKTRVAPKAKSKFEKCETKWCRNKGAVNSSGRSLKLCWKCRSKLLKERHPETYTLNALRNRARQRKIPFTITLAEFRDFCIKTNYLQTKGQDPWSMTIDRIDHNKGYHIWNIQLNSHAENSEKGHTVPGEDCQQNDSTPEEYDYDYAGPGPDYAHVATASEPF